MINDSVNSIISNYSILTVFVRF